MPPDPEVVRAYFHEFAAAELATGGPDPQVLLTARATDHLSDADAAIAIGCFVTPYTCGAAGPLFLAIQHSREPLVIEAWVQEHWAGLPTRRERRAVWKPEKMARSLLSWVTWTETMLPDVYDAPYAAVYDSVQTNVMGYGRYATMKVLEALYQRGLITNPQDDIRPVGAKYPRRFLGWLYPEGAHVLDNGKNDTATIEYTNAIALHAKTCAKIDTMFQHEVLLCNARQGFSGKYPGRSHDRELAHYRKAEAYWGQIMETTFMSSFYDLRAQLFPQECLGELGSPPWIGGRPDLEVAMKERCRSRGLV